MNEDYNYIGDAYVVGYFYEGFLAIQKVIDLSLIVEVNPNFKPDTVFTELQRYPFPSHYEDELSYILRAVFPLFILISFVIIAPTICQEIVLEKENKFKVQSHAYMAHCSHSSDSYIIT